MQHRFELRRGAARRGVEEIELRLSRQDGLQGGVGGGIGKPLFALLDGEERDGDGGRPVFSVRGGEGMLVVMSSDGRLLAAAGVVAWLMVGVPVIAQGAVSSTLLAQWAVAYTLFIALFLADLRRPSLALLGGAAIAVVVTVLLLC